MFFWVRACSRLPRTRAALTLAREESILPYFQRFTRTQGTTSSLLTYLHHKIVGAFTEKSLILLESMPACGNWALVLRGPSWKRLEDEGALGGQGPCTPVRGLAGPLVR